MLSGLRRSLSETVTLNSQLKTLNCSLRWRAAEGAGKRRGDVGSDDLLGRFFGAGFLLGDPPTPGGGLISRPCSRISLIWEPSKVSYSSSAFAMVSSVSRFAISVCLAN